MGGYSSYMFNLEIAPMPCIADVQQYGNFCRETQCAPPAEAGKHEDVFDTLDAQAVLSVFLLNLTWTWRVLRPTPYSMWEGMCPCVGSRSLR